MFPARVYIILYYTAKQEKRQRLKMLKKYLFLGLRNFSGDSGKRLCNFIGQSLYFRKGEIWRNTNTGKHTGETGRSFPAICAGNSGSSIWQNRTGTEPMRGKETAFSISVRETAFSGRRRPDRNSIWYPDMHTSCRKTSLSSRISFPTLNFMRWNFSWNFFPDLIFFQGTGIW